MIKVDVEELERLGEIISSAESLADDIYWRMLSVSEQMEEDIEFMSLPQCLAVRDQLLSSVSYMKNTHDTLLVLKNGILQAPNQFLDCEDEVNESIVRLLSRVDKLMNQMNSFFIAEEENR